MGLDLQLDSAFGRFEVLNGSLSLKEINRTFFSCLISRSYSILNNISVNDTFNLNKDYSLKVSGIINLYNKGFFGNVIILSLEAARLIYNMGPNTYNKLNVMVEDISNINEVKENLNSIYPGLYIRSPKGSIVENLFVVQMVIFNLLLIITIISIILTVYKIFFTYLDNFKDRILEFGVYRTLGYSKKQILKINIYEVLIKTSIGCLIGLFLGYLLNYIVLMCVKINYDLFMPGVLMDLPIFNFNPILDIYAILIGFIISIIAALYPVIKYSKLEIIDILNFNKEKVRKKSFINKIYKRKYLIIIFTTFSIIIMIIFSLNNGMSLVLKNTLLIIFIIITLIISNLIGIFFLKKNKFILKFFKILNIYRRRIISINLKRKIGKNIFILSIFFIGIFSFTLINGVINKISYNFSTEIDIPDDTDIILFSTSPIYPQQFIPSLETLSGIKNASGVGLHDSPIQVNGVTSQVFFFDPKKIIETLSFNYIEGSDVTIQQLNENNSIIISNLLSEELNLHLGNNISINNRSLRIVGIIDDIFSFWTISIETSNFVILSYSGYDNLFNITPMVYSVLVKSSVAPKDTAIDIENNFPGIVCIVVSDIYSEAKSNLLFIEILSNTLILISGGLIVMGTLFVILINMRGRINEIGTYRILGMRKTNIKQVIIGEFIFLISLSLFISMILNLLVIFSMFYLYYPNYAINQLIYYLPVLYIRMSYFGLVILIIDILLIYYYLNRKLKKNLISLFKKNLQ